MKLVTLLLVLSTTISLSAQSLDYTIPEGYEDLVTAKNYKYFVNKVAKELRKNYTIVGMTNGAIELESEDYMAFNVQNLLTLCSQAPKKEWALLIEQHVDAIYQSREKQKELNYANFEAMVPYLSIRIYPDGFVEKYGATNPMVVQKDLEGTSSVLMFDLPTAFIPAYQEYFDQWGKSMEEVFAIAQKNVNKQVFEKESKKVEDARIPFEVHILVEENYGASIALDLAANVPEFVGDWGAVITIPNKTVAMICKVSKEEPLQFMSFIETFQALTEQFYNDHPQRISTDFYWYYQGNFTKINRTINDGQLQVVAPMGLMELMAEK